jgi:alcohol dehydrogenase, propanol-preferring
MVQAGVMGTPLPCTASHEGAGTVIAVGSSVSPSTFQPGDRVMVGLMLEPCGACADCLGPENYRQYCQHTSGIVGVSTDGCFAEYVVCDARMSVKLPDAVPFEMAAPLACAGCTAWRAVLQAELRKGEWLGIVGSGGGLGHLAIQFAKALGLMVVGVDARSEGLDLSREYGADVVVDAREGDEEVVKKAREATSGEGVDATINLSDAKSAAATACSITGRHGVMVQIAQPESVDLPFAELIFRDIRIKGSLICSPDEARRMLDLVAEKGIRARTNVVYGLNEVPTLLKLAKGGKMQGKGVVVVDRELAAK